MGRSLSSRLLKPAAARAGLAAAHNAVRSTNSLARHHTTDTSGHAHGRCRHCGSKNLGRPTLVTRMRKPNATSVRLARPNSRKGRAESARRHAADLGPVVKAVTGIWTKWNQQVRALGPAVGAAAAPANSRQIRTRPSASISIRSRDSRPNRATARAVQRGSSMGTMRQFTIASATVAIAALVAAAPASAERINGGPINRMANAGPDMAATPRGDIGDRARKGQPPRTWRSSASSDYSPSHLTRVFGADL
jgi:hypothetical protein